MSRFGVVFLLGALMAGSSMGETISTGAVTWLVGGNPAVGAPTQSNYFSPFSDGNWISVNSSANAPPGTYFFTLDIGSLIGAAGTFDLSYGADNSVSWSITNGSLSGTLSCLNPNGNCFGPGATPQTVPASLSGTFNANSVLTATVVNDGGNDNPMALFAAGTATASAVPEPSSLAVLALGLWAIVYKARRRS